MKISLNQQIEEVERELQHRRSVYPRLVSSGKMRASVAEYHTARMQAVLKTLMWLANNEADIRADIHAKRGGQS